MARRLLLLLTLMMSTVCASAQPIEVPRVDTPPAMDGRLDDACWGQATVLEDFHVMRGDDPPLVATQARLCRDGVWLYLGFDCAEPDVTEIVAGRFTRDGPVHEDDSVEVFISPYAGGAIYYHFLLSVTNMRAEQSGRPTGTPNRSWDPGWRSATSIGGNGWQAEIGLPIAVLGSTSGDNWLINLCRNKRTQPSQYISLAPVERGYKELERFLALAPLQAEAAPYAPCIRDARVSPYLTVGERFGYNLVLETSNITGEAGELPLTVTDDPQLGETTTVSAELRLGPVEEREVEVFVPVAEPGLREVTVVMTDPATGEQRQWLQVEDTSPLSPLHAYLDRSYYTREDAALAICLLQIPDRALQGWRLVALDGAGKKIAERSDLAGDEIALPIRLTDMPMGTTTLTVQLRDPEDTLVAERPLDLIRLAPNAHEAKIDRVNQVLLYDGEPFFPIGFLTVPGADVPEHARHGMTACSSFALPYRPDELDANDTLWAAAEHGLKCVEYIPRMLKDQDGRRLSKMEPDFPEKMRWVVENTLPGMIEHARDEEALLAYYSIDEPFGDIQYEGCRMLYEAIREHDPYHPVYLLFSSWIPGEQDWSQVMDLVGVDPYMIVGHPTEQGQRFTLQHMAASTTLARKQADEMHSTLWIIPESEFYSGSIRPLLPDEQVCQTWMGLIHGARGLLWFRNPVYHQASWDNFGTLVERVKQLVPALNNRLPDQEVTVLPDTAVRWDFPILHACLLAEPGGGAIVMAANAEPLPVTARFELAGLPRNAKVAAMFGDAAPSRQGAAFTDTVGRYGTRAWHISGWEPPGDGPARLTVTLSGEALAALGGPKLDHPMPPPERNLIANGDLESLDTWDLSPGGGRGNAPAEITFPDSPQTGGKCLRIERDNDFGNACIITREWLELKPNTRYRYGAQMKGEMTRGTGRFSMMLVDESGHGIGWPAVRLYESADDWVSIVQETATGDDPPKFRVWLSQYRVGGVAWFDNVFLEELGPVKRSGNLLNNSSFEHCTLEDWPDLWWPDATIKPRIGAPGAAWGTTDDDAFDGERCMRIIRPGSENGRVYSELNHANESVPGQTYTLSLYARADQPGRKLMMVLDGRGTTVELTDRWARYSATGPFTRTDYRGRPAPLWTDLRCMDEEGTYYIDAVQIEPGEEATEYVQDDWPGAVR